MKVYEIILGIILIGMTQLSQIPADIEVNDVVVESDYSDTEENNTVTESGSTAQREVMLLLSQMILPRR